MMQRYASSRPRLQGCLGQSLDTDHLNAKAFSWIVARSEGTTAPS